MHRAEVLELDCVLLKLVGLLVEGVPVQTLLKLGLVVSLFLNGLCDHLHHGLLDHLLHA